MINGGRYEILRRLGEPGTEATAYLARDRLLAFDIVCRIGKPGADPAVFRKHYKLLLAANAQGLARPLGYFEEGDPPIPVVILEYVQGPTLEAWAKGRSVGERLKAFEQLATTLDSLHSLGLAHGDVHADNVLVTMDRVVLIDPNALGFGSSRERAPNATQSSIKQDIGEFARTFNSAFTTEERAALRPLPAIIDRAKALTEIRQALNSVLTRPDLLGADPMNPAKLARWTAGDKAMRRNTFLRTQRARAMAISGAFTSIETAVNLLAAESGLHFQIEGRETETPYGDEEISSADLKMSRLKSRSMTVRSPDDDELTIRFGAFVGAEFRQPWPTVDGPPSLIDRGEVIINSDHRTIFQVSLEIHFGGGETEAAAIMIVACTHRVPFNAEAVGRLVRILVGWSMPGLYSPMIVAGAKKEMADWGTIDLKLQDDGDLDPEGNLTTPLEGLKQRIWILLSTRPGDLPLHPDFGSQMAMLFETHRTEVPKLLREVLEKTILPDCGECIDCVESFDVARPNRAYKTLEVEIVLWPHALQRTKWTYQLHLK